MNSNSRFFFVLLSVGAAVGIGNIWAYPYLSYMSSGLFFVPYLIALLLLGFPLLMLEFSIGQYFDKNIVDLFASIRKWFSSAGWLMVFNAFIVMSYYAVVLAWHIIYFFVSFGLQWKKDAKSYFFNNVVQASHGFSGFTQFSLPVFIALVLAWAIVFIYIRRGFDTMKKGFLVAFPIFVSLMLLFLLYSLSVDGALNGVHSLLKPRFMNLLHFDVWAESFSLALVSLGLSFGLMHALGRKSGRGFITGNSFVVVIFELVAGFAMGFIMFGILGFLSVKNGIGIGKFVFSDSGSSFTVLPQALPFFYKPMLFSLLFFAFLAVFSVFATASLAYSITHVLVHKFKTRHFNAAIFVAGFGFLFGLLFIIKPGIYIMDIVSHFIYYNILAALMLEVIAVGWFFDSEKIAQHINQNSNLKIGKLWKFFMRYLIPIILLVLLFFQLKSDILIGYNNYPWWALLVFGAGIVIVPLILAFLMPQKIFDRK